MAKSLLPTSSFKLSNFKAEIASSGAARPNRFEVVLRPPIAVLSTMNQDLVKKTSIRCHSASLPALNVVTKDYNHGHSQHRQMPTGLESNPEIMFEFYISNSFDEYRLLANWNTQVLPFANKMDNTAYMLGYYNDLIGEIDIFQLNEANQIIYTAVLKEAYPKQIEQIELRSDQNDIVTLVRVHVAYQSFNFDPYLKGESGMSPTKKHDTIKQLSIAPGVTHKAKGSGKQQKIYTYDRVTPEVVIDRSMIAAAAQLDTGKGRGVYSSVYTQVSNTNVLGQSVGQQQQTTGGIINAIRNLFGMGNKPQATQQYYQNCVPSYTGTKSGYDNYMANVATSNSMYSQISSTIPSDDPLHSMISTLKTQSREINTSQMELNTNYSGVTSAIQESTISTSVSVGG